MEDKKHPGGRPLKFKTVQELEAKIDDYFRSCWDYKRDMFGNRLLDKFHPDFKPPVWKGKGKDKVLVDEGNPVYVMIQVRPYTITGLAVHLDTNRQTLLNYETRDYDPDHLTDDKKEQFFDTIKKAKEKVHAYAEEQLYRPGVAAGAIFNLKNNYDNWRDVRDYNVSEKPKPILGGLGAESVSSDHSAEEDSEASETA